ncbi:MAG: response regulator transcription factor [Armatimonadota bacterium]|nr:response regulator transcription factor [Armatimonadota bacterium]MDR7450533.1 response regulator transcription factor [Armatimonadota bacterium]MDR7466334.1 response regulator transcription factor [Armatimonadota bacterium]MDR7493055.1 response regulator transcription factor [Armatimonadota bacterium]MDR7498188.1 response regulator transcription factor [Armatimonadota bacterium]
MSAAQASPRPYRVLVADPHAAAREAIGMVLVGDQRFEVAGTAGTIEETIRLIRERRPDVLVVDPWLFGAAGLPGCLAAKKLNPNLVIIALLPGDLGDDYVKAARAMGADGVVPKNRVGRDLIAAIHAALDRSA